MSSQSYRLLYLSVGVVLPLVNLSMLAVFIFNDLHKSFNSFFIFIYF